MIDMIEILVLDQLSVVADRVAPSELQYPFAALGLVVGITGGAMLRHTHINSGPDVIRTIGWTTFFTAPFLAFLFAGISHNNPEAIGFGVAGLFGLASGYLGMMGISQSNR